MLLVLLKVVVIVKSNNVIKSKKGQQLNQREIRLINDGVVEGVLLIDIKSKNNNVILTYNTDGLISLQDFLRINEMNKRLFVVLLRNVVVALKSVESNKFSRELIVWDLCTCYVEPSSWHVYLMYVPLQPYETTGDLKAFLQQMVSACNFVSTENVEYIQEFVEELNASVVYTISMLEEYCNKISEQLLLSTSKQSDKHFCSVCSAKLMPQEFICPYCGTEIKGYIQSRVASMCISSAPLTREVDTLDNCDERRSDYCQRTISVNEDENGVVTVFRGMANTVQTIWLEERERAGKILVTKFPFRIGKMEGVTDYRVYNNKVSRKHADILKEQGRYFIVDLGSTNGTYLYGKRIQPGVKEVLSDGTLIRFADAEFKFHID